MRTVGRRTGEVLAGGALLFGAVSCRVDGHALPAPMSCAQFEQTVAGTTPMQSLALTIRRCYDHLPLSARADRESGSNTSLVVKFRAQDNNGELDFFTNADASLTVTPEEFAAKAAAVTVKTYRKASKAGIPTETGDISTEMSITDNTATWESYETHPMEQPITKVFAGTDGGYPYVQATDVPGGNKVIYETLSVGAVACVRGDIIQAMQQTVHNTTVALPAIPMFAQPALDCKA